VDKLARIAALTVLVLLVFAAPAFAQDGEGSSVSFSGAFGAGMVVIGGAYGIGKLASAALEAMARQPEIAGTAQVAMIIAAALIEGFTFYALIICQGQNPFPPVAG
jgi:F-type H+-transporting ATPase subunit c